VKNTIKQIIKKILPRSIQPYSVAVRIIEENAHNTVVSGPFRGMKLIGQSVGSEYYPKLLGTYELELWQIVEELCSMQFDTIINVGAAEGYYSIGFALRLPRSHIIAFEANKRGRSMIAEMASINQVQDRIQVQGFCDAAGLAGCFRDEKSVLVLMDIEGSEGLLLDPYIIPDLSKSYIFVEIHDYVSEEIGSLILRRFTETHHIDEIWSADRNIDNFPISLSPLMTKWIDQSIIALMSEYRPTRMRWLYLKPRQ
jgi:hypothetical protein